MNNEPISDATVAAFRSVLGDRALRSTIESLIRSGVTCYDGSLAATCGCRINPRTLRTNCNH